MCLSIIIINKYIYLFMDKVIGNKKIYEFVKKYKKEEWDNVVELLCFVDICNCGRYKEN